MNRHSILKKIESIDIRIEVLNEVDFNPCLSITEVNKANKLKKSLVKTKNKLLKKLGESHEC